MSNTISIATLRRAVKLARSRPQLDGWLIVPAYQFHDPKVIRWAKAANLQLVNRDALQERMLGRKA